MVLEVNGRKPDVFCLMGPTASGKTALAVELVQRFPFEIISVDSAQVYRGMDIGSGKPDAEILKIAPHRLIDINDPSDPYSAADFRRDALEHIEDIVSQQRVPLLVGGTMLYFRILRDGLAQLPEADPRVRAEIEKLGETEGWENVHRRLAEVDPESARRIHPNDPQRLQRALEVFRLTGRTMTELHREGQAMLAENKSLPFNLHFMAIQPEQRDVLHALIKQRFKQMLQAGLVEEVEVLYKRDDLSPTLPSIKSVGYRQVWQYLSGELSYDEMLERGIIATRQLAKRQFTWLRSWPELHDVGSDKNKFLGNVLKIVNAAKI